MPINTDLLDLKQPLAGQDIAAARTELENPVLDPDKVAALSQRLKSVEAVKANLEPKAAETGATGEGGEAATAEPEKKDTEPAAAPAKAEPAKAAAPEKTDQPPQLDLSAIHSPRMRDAFQRLEQARDSFKEKATTAEKRASELAEKVKPLEDELAKLKSTAPADLEALRTKATRVDELEKVNADLLQRVETLNLEHSPRFQNWWKTETNKHIKMAQRVVPAEKREKFGKLLMEPPTTERDAAIDAIVEELPKSSQRLINGAIEQLESVKIQREEALTQGSERWKELQAHEREEQAKRDKVAMANRDRITKAALDFAHSLDAFKPIDGDDEHNKQIPVREAFIKAAIAGELDEETAVALAPRAFEAVYYRDKVIPQLKSELEKANALIKQLQAARPSGQTTPSTTPATVKTTRTLGNPNELKSVQWAREHSIGG